MSDDSFIAQYLHAAADLDRDIEPEAPSVTPPVMFGRSVAAGQFGFGSFQLADILFGLPLNAFTGVVRVHGRVARSLWICCGQFCQVESANPRETLEHYLALRGLEIARPSVLQDYQYWLLCKMLQESGGEWSCLAADFTNDSVPQPLQPLLLEVLTRVDELQYCDALLPYRGTQIFKLNGSGNGQESELDGLIADVYALLEAPQTLQLLIDVTERGEYEVKRAITDLFERGLVATDVVHPRVALVLNGHSREETEAATSDLVPERDGTYRVLKRQRASEPVEAIL